MANQVTVADTADRRREIDNLEAERRSLCYSACPYCDQRRPQIDTRLTELRAQVTNIETVSEALEALKLKPSVPGLKFMIEVKLTADEVEEINGPDSYYGEDPIEMIVSGLEWGTARVTSVETLP